MKDFKVNGRWLLTGLVLLAIIGFVVAAGANRVNEISTNGTAENLILNATGTEITVEKSLNATAELYVGTSISIETSDASGAKATALGTKNTASGDYASVLGGTNNTAGGTNVVVVGGLNNWATQTESFIGSGRYNQATGTYAVVSGGDTNTASGLSSVVSGGNTNTASASQSNVAGGLGNVASFEYAAVLGGNANTAADAYSSIGGGDSNTIDGGSGYSFIGGGYGNTASDDYAVVLGGNTNTASGEYSLVGVGDTLVASADYTTAFGRDYENPTEDSFTVGYGDITLNVTDDLVYVVGDVNATNRICDSTGCIPAAGAAAIWEANDAGTINPVDDKNLNITGGVIYSDENLAFKFSGDDDDFLSLLTAGDETLLNRTGDTDMYYVGDVPRTAYNKKAIKFATLDHVSQVQVLDSAGSSLTFSKYNESHATHPDSGVLSMNDVGVFKIIVDDDNDDYGQFNTASNVFQFTPNADSDGALGTEPLSWANAWIVSINGADICLANGWCLTEFNNDGQKDVCIVTQKPTKEMERKMGLAGYSNFTEYVSNHMVSNQAETAMVYDESFTEAEFNQILIEIYPDGILDLTFGRNCHGSFREVKSTMDRQEELIQILYDNGDLTGQEATHLRDDY